MSVGKFVINRLVGWSVHHNFLNWQEVFTYLQDFKVVSTDDLTILGPRHDRVI